MERDSSAGNMTYGKIISTHTLTWSVTNGQVTEKYQRLYFNSHAHVERDLPDRAKHILTCISTHTLTWSVTKERYEKYIAKIISTHTLTWSVTFKLDFHVNTS